MRTWRSRWCSSWRRNRRCHRRSHDASRLGLATAVALWIQSLDTEALDLFKRLWLADNVRELENLIRRVAYCVPVKTSASTTASALREPVLSETGGAEEGASLATAAERYLTNYFRTHGDRLPPPGLYDRILQEVERPLISICLAATRGNQIRAAQLLGVNRNTLRKKIRDLGLEVIKGLKAD